VIIPHAPYTSGHRQNTGARTEVTKWEPGMRLLIAILVLLVPHG
jgi:hypothetical protein